MVRLYFGAGFRQVNGADIIESGSNGFADVPDHLVGDPAVTQHVKDMPSGAATIPASESKHEHEDHEEH